MPFARFLHHPVTRRAFVSLAAACLACYAVSLALPFGFEETVPPDLAAVAAENTVRLRVIADNDSPEAQSLKLAVRDDLLALASTLFADCENKTAAETRVLENLETLRTAAADSLRRHGADLPVRVRYTRETVPVRRYGDLTFPAGVYDTLRVELGNAAGHNWWCVLFPPLCLAAATGDLYADRKVFTSRGFPETEAEALESSGPPQIRFALWEALQARFSGS